MRRSHHPSPPLTTPHQRTEAELGTQLTLDLWRRERSIDVLSRECLGRGLEESDVALLAAIAREDQARESESFACKSKRAWGKCIGRDPNTAVAAMRRLALAGVAAWDVSSDGYAIAVDWKAVFALPPKESRREARRRRLSEQIPRGGEEVVRGGEGSDTCSWRQETKPREPCTRGIERVSASPAEPRGEAFPAKPWARVDGLSSERLSAAVRDRDERVLTGLYFAGIESGWWQDCEAFRVRFLACCWQAVESAKSSPMGLLNHMVRKNLCDRDAGDRDGWITEAADDWAAATRKAWHRRRVERDEAAMEREQAWTNCGD